MSVGSPIRGSGSDGEGSTVLRRRHALVAVLTLLAASWAAAVTLTVAVTGLGGHIGGEDAEPYEVISDLEPEQQYVLEVHSWTDEGASDTYASTLLLDADGIPWADRQAFEGRTLILAD